MLGIGIGIGMIFGGGTFQQMLTMAGMDCDRASSHLFWGYPTDGVIADEQSLLTVPDDIMTFTGGRLLSGNVWSNVDANGVALPSPSALIEDARTNYFKYRRDLSNAVWNKTGGCTITKNLTGADGVANSAWTLGGIDTTSDYLHQVTSGLLTSQRYEICLVLKQISTSGVLWIKNPQSKLGGEWRVDLSLLSSTQWEVVDRNHPAVTIINEFVSYTVAAGILITKYSGTGTLSVGYFDCQQELSAFSTSIVPETNPATTNTRADDVVTTLMPSVLGGASGAIEFTVIPAGTGQVAKYALASTVDASNLLAVKINATTIDLIKKVTNTDYSAQEAYVHAAETKLRIQLYWDGSGIGIRAADASADITTLSFHTNANALDMPLDTDLEIGNQDGANIFVGDYPVDDFKFYTSKVAVGWL